MRGPTLEVGIIRLNLGLRLAVMALHDPSTLAQRDVAVRIIPDGRHLGGAGARRY
jgi:hypothetical protein